MPDALTFLSSVGVSGLLTAALIFLAKSIISERLKNSIKNEYDEKLAAFQAKLKAESDTELERLKAQLQIAANERSIRLTRVFEMTAETIATTYAKLLYIDDAMKDLTRPFDLPGGQSKEERVTVVTNRSKEFLQYFAPRRIYLPRETAQQAAIYYNNVLEAAVQFHLATTGNNEPSQEILNETIMKLNNEFPKLRQLLEDEFRRVLDLKN